MPKFFIDRPVFAWVIALIILLAGGISATQLPIAQYPEVAPPAIAITTVYPGASAEVVEDTVTTLIEQEMNGIEDMLYMDSSSDSAGNMSINISFATGTDLDIASVEAQNRIARVEARLPEEVRRQGIQVLKSRRNYLLFISLFSPDKSLDRTGLGSYGAANVLEPIRRVAGVGEAQLFGSEYAMRIWLDPDKLTSFGLTPGDALAAVRAQNVQLATGEIGQVPAVPGQQINATIVTQGYLQNPEQFSNIIIRANTDGSTVRVKDVGRVELGSADYSVQGRINGQPSAFIGIKLTPDGNALETAQAVRDRMTELARFFPQGIAWEIPYDTSKFVEISIKEVAITLFEAMLLVFLVMFLFLQNLRATFIPAIVVPIALMGTFIGLLAFGYSINVLTLFGMVLVIGIVVDDAIVVVENVERIMREEGLPPRVATRKAMGQITGAIIGITLVLCAVFVPMAFFPGSTGAIYRQFAVTMILAILFSVLMAFTLTPALCANLLKAIPKGGGHAPRGFGWFNRGFGAMTRGYQASVARVLSRTGMYLLIYAVLIAATAWLFLRLPGSFLPEEDQGYFITMAQLPPGATQERTLHVLEQIENYYMQQPEVARVVGIAGFSFFGRGQNAALAFITLKPWDEREEPENTAAAIVQRAGQFLSQIKQAFAFAVNVPPIPELAAVGGFDFRLQDRGGVGREQLVAARGQVLGMASQNPALVGVRPEGLEDAPQVRLEIDRAKARALGVSIDDLNQTLQVALGSRYINDFIRDGRILRVQMQAEAKSRMTPEHIMKLHLRNGEGEVVPLSTIVKADWTVGPPKLDRYNGLPSYKIAGNAAPGRSTGEAMQAMEEIAAKLPPGIGFEWSGTSREERVAGAQAPALFALSVLVVFLCLAALYESWTIPVAVLLVVPLGVFGAVIATTLRGLPDDVYFKVGLIAIIGLSAKNAILIIEFAKDLHARGMSLIDATLEATRIRFRPILMTSIAFILGVLPLAVSTGAGAAGRHAIGTGVMGGMIGATALAVFLVPVFFVVIRKLFPGRREERTSLQEKPADA
ncbi:MAG: efflux RND transporter permease subunit [Burkholderiales bacterium]